MGPAKQIIRISPLQFTMIDLEIHGRKNRRLWILISEAVPVSTDELIALARSLDIPAGWNFLTITSKG